MKKYRNRILAGMGTGFVVIIAVMLISDTQKLAAQAVAFPWVIMLPALGLRLVNWALRFVKWHYYLGVVGVRDFSPVDSSALFISGFSLSISPGKVAELLKSFVLKNITGAPISETVPVIAAERLSDGIAVLGLAAISIVVLAADRFWPVVLVSLATMGAGLGALQYRPLSLWLLDRLIKLPVLRRFATPVRALYESGYALFRPRVLLISTALGIVANFTDGVGVYLILLGVGAAPSSTLFFQALLIISLSVVVGSMSGLPGGMGAAELSIGILMQELVGLDLASAGFVTLLARFIQLWFGVIVALGVAFWFRRRLFPPSLEMIINAEGRETVSPHV